MARDHARINLSIWQDDDFRALPGAAQHLYWLLWTHPELNYAGVVDWRPGRLAALVADWNRDTVHAAADCLEHRLFIVRDDETEECLVRSWVRFDGLTKSPQMAVSFANAYAATASSDIRGVIVHEAIKLRDLEPGNVGWDKKQVQELLSRRALDPRSRDLPADPLAPGVAPPLAPAVAPPLGGNRGARVSTPSSTPSTPAPAPAPSTPTTSEIADAMLRPDVDALLDHFDRQVAANDPEAKLPARNKKNRDAARLLLDRDDRTVEQVKAAIDFATGHEFWRTNILSMSKLREKYDQLRAQAQRKPGSGIGSQPSPYDNLRVVGRDD